ncbi:MAG TPA: MFS transporter [Acidimicrobiales bacterium]
MTTRFEPTTTQRSRTLSRGMIYLFAFACGATVANLYYAQPILDTLAKSFGASTASAGLIATAAQIGYALGLALLVPLGDLVARRFLVPIVLVVTALSLAACAFAPSIGVLTGLSLVVGAGSVAAQLLVPMVASLAGEEERGRVVGVVMSGLLMGILLARTVSGLLAQALGWRSIFVLAALISAGLAVVLRRKLPVEEERPRVSYIQLLLGVVRLMLSESTLRRRALFGALVFGAFSVFWTTMSFLLAAPPFHFGSMAIGLFGLVGAGGALMANFAGRLVDRGTSKLTTLIFAALVATSFLMLWWGRHDLVMLILGILVLDAGVQGLHVTNQSLVYKLAPHLRSRVTSAYMVSCFIGGAVGSAAGSEAFALYHWAGVCILGGVVGVAALIVAAVTFFDRKSVGVNGG